MCLKIMEAYVVVPRALRLLRKYWYHLPIVEQAEK